MHYGQQIDFTKLKVVNYNRKSSEGEDRQMLSVDSQIDEAGRVAEYYKLSTFVEVINESKSAKKTEKRPGFQRMMELITKGKADCIVCWKLDRLARNMTDGGVIIDLLSEGTIKAIITHDKVFYPWDNISSISIELMQGKQFLKDLSSNVKRGQTKKASNGTPHGMATLGFLNDRSHEKGNRKWYVDNERFWKVKKLFEMFLTGTISAGRLHDYAIDTLKLTTVKRKRSGGEPITKSRVYEILKDSTYAGYFHYNKIRYELDKNLPRIITENERERVLQLLSGKNIPKVQKHQATYSGFITSNEGDSMGQDIKFQLICDCKHKFAYRSCESCPKCGRMIDNLIKPKYLITTYYYNVRKKKKRLEYKSLNENMVVKEFKNQVVDNLSFSNDLLEWSKKYIGELKDKEIDEEIQVSKDKERRTLDFEEKKRKTREMLRDEKITEAEYKMDLEKLKRDYSDLLEKTTARDWQKEMLEITNIMGEIEKIMESGTTEARRLLLSQLGSNLVWNDEKLFIYNKKSIMTLIKGINCLRTEYPKFEPKKYVMTQGSNEKTEPKDPVFSTMLALLRDFRTLDWAEEYKYPTVILSQMKQLLAEHQEG